MTELDFEELDKAVAGLMSNVDTNKRNPALDDPEDKVITLSSPTTEKPTELVESSTAVVPPVDTTTSPVSGSPAPEATAATPASLAVKRRGQFMDMIHPSSDMKSAPQRPSRQGVTIAPLDASSRSTPQTVTDSGELKADSAESNAFGEIPAPEPLTAQPSIEPLDQPTVDEPSFSPAPLTSPFLSDAKPEKRPLGGPALTDTAEQSPETAQVPETPQTPELGATLPEEFHGDVLAVESNNVSEQELVEAPEPTADLASTNSETSPRESDQTDTMPVASMIQQPEVVADPPSVPAGGSIAQQYTETPSTGDQTTGSIYDTASYHQAISPTSPVKKKSSTLKWILISLGLIILGGGAGVGYFFLTH